MIMLHVRAILGLLVIAGSMSAADYTFTTLTGRASEGSDDGTGTAARFNSPWGAALDADGNLFVSDEDNYTIRKVTPAGVVTTFAGTAGRPGTTDGTGAAARFKSPHGAAFDNAGTLYVLEPTAIRKITPAGAVTTLVGDQNASGTTDGASGVATFTSLLAIRSNAAGDLLYVVDQHAIRTVTLLGTVTTIAGSITNGGYLDAAGTAARFNYPTDLVFGPSNDLFVSDTQNDRIRRIDMSGGPLNVTTFAGSGSSAYTDGTGTAASFSNPKGLSWNAGDSTFLLCDGTAIRSITAGGVVSLYAGATGVTGGIDDATATAARFYNPISIVRNASGAHLVVDRVNSTVRHIATSGAVTTLAGYTWYDGSRGEMNGARTEARFRNPAASLPGSDGSLLIADRGNHVIRKLSSGGTVSTFVGSMGVDGGADGSGTAATFTRPHYLAWSTLGSFYVADETGHTIRHVTSLGVVTTFAGTHNTSGSTDANGSNARFNQPAGLAVDGSGSVYVADSNNHTIRKITVGGLVTTFAGSAGVSGSTDGVGSAARFDYPRGLALVGTTLYVTDNDNHTIRAVSTITAAVTTLAGSPGISGHADGTGTAARFNFPEGITTDGSGNLLVADLSNHTIRKVTPAGVVTTVGGRSDAPAHTDGTGTTALFYNPYGISQRNGVIYIADTDGNVIRKGVRGSGGGSGSGGSGSGAGAGGGSSGGCSAGTAAASILILAGVLMAGLRRRRMP